MKKYDVTALGELLIDFTENGKSNQGNPLFEANPGGAPCNVLAMLAKLGHNTAFIGKVGNDFFGEGLLAGMETMSSEEKKTAVQKFADYAARKVPTFGNMRGSAEYRTLLVKVLTRRALEAVGGMTDEN